MARCYPVFNADQVDGFLTPTSPEPLADERNQNAEAFFGNIGTTVRHGGDQAFYSPSTDHIQMPVFEAFHSATAYYSTLAHEIVHYTGGPHRLNRDVGNRFGSEAYAAEELVELGAAFICGELGLGSEPRPDHAAYLQTWLKVLRGNRRAIFTAASHAQQAVDFLHNLQPQHQINESSAA
jgi:antirestriction protein ArdC